MKELIIGIGKKPGGPPPRPSGMRDMPGAREEAPDTEETDPIESGKVTPEEALVVRAGHDCDDCKNYQSDTGECAKVEGQFSPEDACLRYFEAKDEESDDEAAEDIPEEPEEPVEYGAPE